MNIFYVYILRCHDTSYYIGHTDNIEKRMAEHRSGAQHIYTKKRLPVELVFLQEYPTRDDAFNAEHTIKKWSRRKKEALIQSAWPELKKLAKKNFSK